MEHPAAFSIILKFATAIVPSQSGLDIELELFAIIVLVIVNVPLVRRMPAPLGAVL